MFRRGRPRIRDVDVEVVGFVGDDAIVRSSEEPGPSGDRDNGARASNGSVDDVLHADVRQILASEVDEPDTPDFIPPTPETTVEPTAESAPDRVDEPAVEEPREPKRPQAQPAPSLPPPPKARVVWSSSSVAKTPRTHTLKLKKPAPSQSTRPAPVPRSAPTPQPPPRTPAPVEREPEPMPAEHPRVEAPDNPPAPEPTAREQTCDIHFWRGYRKAAFYGRTFDETGEPVAVAESPFFRPHGNGAPDPTEAAKAAYEALRSELIAAGWEPASAGEAWFEETFRLTAAPEPAPE